MFEEFPNVCRISIYCISVWKHVRCSKDLGQASLGAQMMWILSCLGTVWKSGLVLLS